MSKKGLTLSQLWSGRYKTSHPGNSVLLEENDFYTNDNNSNYNNDLDEDDDEDNNNTEKNDVSNIDDMLLGLIQKHEESAVKVKSNLSNMKVTELRQLIKEKNIKVNNISKLKKDECIEILS